LSAGALRAAARSLALLAAVFAALPEGAARAAGPDPAKLRIQAHRNALRGVAYLELSTAGAPAGDDRLEMRPILVIPLPGDGTINVLGNLYPLDGDGDGTFEFLHFNGFRTMRTLAQDGRTLWQVENPAGRVHRSIVHRDSIAVLDLDGAEGQEVVHCWPEPDRDRQRLVVRSGADGRVLRETTLANPADEECQIATFFFEGRPDPLILVAEQGSAESCAAGIQVDNLTRVAAYDSALRVVWQSSTCAAGHYFWPVDADGNGRAEAVLAGKYLLDPDGKLVCWLADLGPDHVDSAVVADLDPTVPGLEIAIAAQSGTRLYAAANCARRWSIPPAAFKEPQNVAAARLVPDRAAPSLVVHQRGSERDSATAFLSVSGAVLGRYGSDETGLASPYQNADLDGLRGRDDLIGLLGTVMGADGEERLGTGWYWSLQALSAEETTLHRFEKWSSHPFAFDVDGDGIDELVTWGRHLIVVGKIR
jgi:hypothetical protein